MKFRNSRLVLFLLLCAAPPAMAQTPYRVLSPDKQIEIVVRAAGRIQYDVLVKGNPVLRNSTFSIHIDQTTLGANVRVKAVSQRTNDQMIEPAVRQKSVRVRDAYNELRIDTEENLSVVFRAYNEGAAYRLETSLPKPEVKVIGEEAAFNFAGDYTVFYPREDNFFSHNERQYAPVKLSSIAPAAIASLPAVVDAGGIKVAIANSDVEDYPCLWLRGTAGNGLAATFPPYPLKETLAKDRDYRVTQAAEYIAVTRGTRTYPWRVLGIAQKDGDLVTNQLVWLLQKPSQVPDTSWIKPGKVAWDWYNANNVYGVDFKSGINTQTYKYFIDFAAKYGIEYVILDEGWYKLGNVLDVVPEMNIEELTAYGKQKNVGIILWVVWKTLGDQLQPALDQYAKWGIKGVKVDFMQRSDQVLMRYYHQLAAETAKRKMLLDFHGAQVPASMTRTWPNLITTEGVKGLEWSKWSAETDPLHNVTLPFTRMFLGPMDFTPGAMLNANKSDFAQIFNRPMALGTRSHQLAMYVVFESPLQMLADNPSNYLREPESMEFLAKVPTVWDETRVLDARIAEYAVVARRSGRDWYIGAMTNWTPRDLEIDFSFLLQASMQMESYQDGANAARMASDYKLVRSKVSGTTRWKVHLEAGGGWAARVHP